MIVVGELPVVELLIHVGVGDEIVEKVDEDQIGDIDNKEKLEDRVTLSENGGAPLLEAENRLDELHLD